MTFIVRRKDPPAYDGAMQRPWQTVARRKTLKEAQAAKKILQHFASPLTKWWVGEEIESHEEREG